MLTVAVSLVATPALGQAVVKVATVDAAAMLDFRDRLQSALLESGALRLSTTQGGRDLPTPDVTLSARVQPQGMTASVASGRNYCIGGTRLGGTIDVRMRNAATGAVIWGGIVTTSIAVGSDMRAGDYSDGCSAMTPDSASYRRLTTALALAVARRVTFRITPLRVTAVEGRTVILNRGAPLVPLGATVLVAGATGAPLRLQVTAASGTSASATFAGDPGAISPGAIAEVLEEDDSGANARRYQKVELP